MKINFKSNQQGSIFPLALIALTSILVITVVLVSNSFTLKESSKYSLNKLEAVTLAEAGLDKAVASLNANPAYNGESETALGQGSYSVTVASLNATDKMIESTGYIPSKTDPKLKQTIKIQISKGVGISFVYGLLVGNGGITMGNGSTINGSVYSNGNILGGNNETITDTVIVAGGTQPTADPQRECTSNCGDYYFGKNVSGENRLDVAQSFKPTSNAVINKVSLKLKKCGNSGCTVSGSPANATIRILADSGGKPDKNNVLTPGVLPADLVTNQYGFVDVTFSSTPTLSSNSTYWIMMAAQTLDNSNYWAWSRDTLGGYNQGSPAWSANWQAHTPVWTNISGDLDFKVYMGGVATSIVMGNGSKVNGSVYANTINGFTIKKDAYYQTINNTIVQGTSYPNSTDKPPVAMPISQANIDDWKPQTPLYGGLTGCPSSIGPGKYDGSFTTVNTCTIMVKTPVWITGNLVVGNGITFKMDPSLGSSSGVMIVDGTTTFSNTDDLQGTGEPGSYLTLLSTYDSPLHGGTVAIDTGNSSITGILYAPYGILTLANKANFKEAVAWQLNVGTGTVLTYDSGLISTFFSTGPTGAFNIIKGTYQIK